jgi:1,4-dihydroxy-2-naphthoate octaprenyltransferase
MKSFAGIIRLPFLVLSPACIFLAAALAQQHAGSLQLSSLLLVLVCSIAAHISVNALNEYQDFRSGLDLDTERTPFSGGSGTLPAKPAMAPVAYKISLIALVITLVAGLLLIYRHGSVLIIPGLVVVALVLFYTSVINRYPFTCLLSPGLGFGIVMVGGSYFVFTGNYSWEIFLVSLVPFFLINNLLLLNQFPDVEADRQVGRKHVTIHYGYRRSSQLYLLFLLLAAVALILSVLLRILPLPSLLGLLLIAAAYPVYRAASRFQHDTESLIPYMGRNVAVVLFTPVLIGAPLYY